MPKVVDVEEAIAEETGVDFQGIEEIQSRASKTCRFSEGSIALRQAIPTHASEKCIHSEARYGSV